MSSQGVVVKSKNNNAIIISDQESLRLLDEFKVLQEWMNDIQKRMKDVQAKLSLYQKQIQSKQSNNRTGNSMLTNPRVADVLLGRLNANTIATLRLVSKNGVSYDLSRLKEDDVVRLIGTVDYGRSLFDMLVLMKAAVKCSGDDRIVCTISEKVKTAILKQLHEIYIAYIEEYDGLVHLTDKDRNRLETNGYVLTEVEQSKILNYFIFSIVRHKVNFAYPQAVDMREIENILAILRCVLPLAELDSSNLFPIYYGNDYNENGSTEQRLCRMLLDRFKVKDLVNAYSKADEAGKPFLLDLLKSTPNNIPTKEVVDHLQSKFTKNFNGIALKVQQQQLMISDSKTAQYVTIADRVFDTMRHLRLHINMDKEPFDIIVANMSKMTQFDWYNKLDELINKINRVIEQPRKGGGDCVQILGRHRRIVTKRGIKYVKYKGAYITLSRAKKIEAPMI